MTQQAGYDFDVHLIGEQLTGKCVAESVDTNMGYPGSFQNTVVRPVQISRINRVSCGIGKHQRKTAIDFLQFSKSLKCRLIQRNRAVS